MGFGADAVGVRVMRPIRRTCARLTCP